jgi:hypothetical protein
MDFKSGDKVIVSSKQGKPVYGFDENNVYGKIGESEEKWSFPFAVEVIEIVEEKYHVTDISELIDPEKNNIRLATEEEIRATEDENRKNYEAVQRGMARGEQMGEVLGKGQVEADKNL